MIELLLYSLDRAAMFFNAILQLVFLVAQGRKLLLKLSTIAEQVHELVRVLYLLRLSLEDSCQACHCIPLYIIHPGQAYVRCGIRRNDRSCTRGKL